MPAQRIDYSPVGYTVTATAVTGYLVAQLYMSLLVPFHYLLLAIAVAAYSKAGLSFHKRLPAATMTTKLALLIHRKVCAHIENGCTMLYPTGDSRSGVVHVLLRKSGDSVVVIFVGWGTANHSIGEVVRVCEISPRGRIIRRTNGAHIDPHYHAWCHALDIRRLLEYVYRTVYQYSPRRELSKL